MPLVPPVPVTAAAARPVRISSLRFGSYREAELEQHAGANAAEPEQQAQENKRKYVPDSDDDMPLRPPPAAAPDASLYATMAPRKTRSAHSPPPGSPVTISGFFSGAALPLSLARPRRVVSQPEPAAAVGLARPRRSVSRPLRLGDPSDDVLGDEEDWTESSRSTASATVRSRSGSRSRSQSLSRPPVKRAFDEYGDYDDDDDDAGGGGGGGSGAGDSASENGNTSDGQYGGGGGGDDGDGDGDDDDDGADDGKEAMNALPRWTEVRHLGLQHRVLSSLLPAVNDQPERDVPSDFSLLGWALPRDRARLQALARLAGARCAGLRFCRPPLPGNQHDVALVCVRSAHDAAQLAADVALLADALAFDTVGGEAAVCALDLGELVLLLGCN